MPRHSLQPSTWLGKEQRVYWFGFLLVIGFVLFAVFLLITFPVTALYVVLAILHSPIHLFLLRQCLRIRALRRRTERATVAVASILSGALTLLLLATVAVAVLAIARNLT